MQKTTIPTQIQYMRTYLGYAVRYHNIDPDALSLKLDLDGKVYAGFISWLRARGSGKSHLVKHVSLARKIVYYLRKTTRQVSDGDKQHSVDVDEWLEALSKQLHASMAKPVREYVPDLASVFQWARKLTEEVVEEMIRELEETGGITEQLARRNHDVLIICLVAGTVSPPLRLWILKTLAPPEFAIEHGCQDSDCRLREREGGCLGNTVQVLTLNEGSGK